MSAREAAEIQNLLAEYCLAADDCRFDDWARCFTADGEMQGPADSARGLDDLVRFISSAAEGLHLCGIPLVRIDGDRADARVNFVFVTHDKAIRTGIYEDELIRTDAGWRIQRRRGRLLRPTGR